MSNPQGTLESLIDEAKEELVIAARTWCKSDSDTALAGQMAGRMDTLNELLTWLELRLPKPPPAQIKTKTP